MEGLINSFRRSRKKTSHRQMIVSIKNIDDKKKAVALIGKKVTWSIEGKKQTKIVGVVNAAHGRKGCVRVVFEKGMPGQAISTKVKIE